jgi:hypothetical protein
MSELDVREGFENIYSGCVDRWESIGRIKACNDILKIIDDNYKIMGPSSVLAKIIDFIKIEGS